MALYKTLVKKVSISPEKKTKQKDYLPKGQLPIIDQGQQLIGGYLDNSDLQLSCNLPVIVFGDHTRAVKYVDFPFGAGADGIKVLEPADGIYPKFLYYATQYLVLRLEDRGYARHYQYIEKKELDIPSIPEQKRIVARIEELFSELDNGVETLRKTKQQLAVYRQAVVKSVLDAYCKDANTVKIGDVCHDVKVGIVIKPTQYYVQSGGVRAFRNANVRRNYIEDNDWAMISQEGHKQNSRSEIHNGDVLIARSGVNLGMAAAVPEQYDGYNAIDVVIAVPKQDVVLPRYLAYYTNSPYGIISVKRNQRGVAQGHLNITVYGKLPLLLPTIDVQNAIIKEIDARLSACDNIEKTVDIALQQAEAMRQSILKQAFEGRL